MSDEQIRERVIRVFNDWINLNFHEKYKLASTFGSPTWKQQHDDAIREFGIKWDQTLNVIGVRRIEHHLNIPPRKDRIRIRDPFGIGPNRRRDLEMTRDQATKILVMGMP